VEHLHGPQVVAAVLLLAFACQWLAWRTRVPALLYLLGGGLALQPVLLSPGLREPVGGFTEAFVPVAAGLILFEGGLSIRLQDLTRFRRPVRGLLGLSLVVTWVLAGFGAYWLTPLGPGLSALLGAILVVTGPTVIGPLFRHLRVRGDAALLLRIEGVLNDPVGAVLAIVTFQVIQTGGVNEALEVALWGVFRSALVAVPAGLAAAGAWVLVQRRQLIPIYLESAASVAGVITLQSAVDTVQAESGLLAVTVAGVALASQSWVSVHALRRSNEDVQVVLVSVLFVVLMGQVELSSLGALGWGSLVWVLSLMLVVRPVAIAVGLLGSRVDGRERWLMAAVAPRGVVAAAVASVFSLKLEGTGLEGTEFFFPLTVAVVASTVLVYGLSTPLVARWLGLTEPDPQGLVVLGIHPFSRSLAARLRERDLRVLLLDEDRQRVLRARRDGDEAEWVLLPSEDELDALDLSGIGHFLGVSHTDERNALAALQFRERFDRQCYQIADEATVEIPAHLRGAYLQGVDRRQLFERLARGSEVKATPLSESFDREAFRERNPDAMEVCALDGQNRLLFPLDGAGPRTAEVLFWVPAEPRSAVPAADQAVIPGSG
jgi:NhaP-type Na+/H+ or K+/H+ antiporter